MTQPNINKSVLIDTDATTIRDPRKRIGAESMEVDVYVLEDEMQRCYIRGLHYCQRDKTIQCTQLLVDAYISSSSVTSSTAFEPIGYDNIVKTAIKQLEVDDGSVEVIW